jgi:hypothetical protein
MSSGGAFANPPAAERPRTPDTSYGVPRTGGRMADWAFVIKQLADARNYWVATVGADGRPHAAPVWGVLVADDLYLETSPATRKARNIERSGALTVHVGGDEAVIVEGDAAAFRPAPALGREIAAAFKAKYADYSPEPDSWDQGGLYRVVPRTVFAWRDMPTAARWRFQRQ